MKKAIVEKFILTKRGRWAAAFLMAITGWCFNCSMTAAQAPSRPPVTAATQEQKDTRPAQLTTSQQAAQKYFTDVELLNQNSEKMRLYSDLLKDKVVVINFFFATCQGVCLPMNRNLEKVQEALGERLGKDVYIISITVDPTVDTPASLKEYAKKMNAKSGWHFITGAKENVEFALRKLGQYVDNKEEHTNIIIIGNERTGLWKKAFGLAKSDELNKVVESVLNDQPAGEK
ncbi:MAG: SCO family protein [Pyrinomonadaceae bacterium]|nr:SCO family protein [Pyrinomonadaceae bacterium]